MDATFFIGLITLAVLKSAPLVFGALCGLLGERSGVINIGIEGMMLLGAFFAFLTSALFNQWTGGVFAPEISLIVGLACAIIVSMLPMFILITLIFPGLAFSRRSRSLFYLKYPFWVQFYFPTSR
jgi:ABC-type uncharacterized transport system permease subunit